MAGLSHDFVRRVLAVFIFSCSVVAALAHDPYEITTKVYLRTNNLELRLTLASTTVESLLAADDEHAPVSEVLSDLEKNRAQLNRCAAGVFLIVAGNRRLTATHTNVALTVEDHVEFTLTYPRPAQGNLRLNAVALSKLPDNEPYGAIVTLTDFGNGNVLAQKLLTASDPSLEVDVVDPPPAETSLSSPPASSKGPATRTAPTQP